MSMQPENQLEVIGNSCERYLADNQKKIASYLTNADELKRFMRIVANEAKNNPDILKCTKDSFMDAVLKCARLKLTPGSIMGECYILPFKNTQKGVHEAQFMLGYKGMIILARRSNMISSISANCVYENDTFELELGLNEKLRHVPAEGHRGKFRAVYAVAHFKDGGHQLEVMFKGDVDEIKSKSKTANRDSSPWNTAYPEMAKKSAVRRMYKYLPVSVESLQDVSEEEASERGETINYVDFNNVPEKPSKTEEMAKKLESRLEGESILDDFQEKFGEKVKVVNAI